MNIWPEAKKYMPLRQYINYACFDSLEGHDGIIDELYAANYFMWFKLRRLHEFPIGDADMQTVKDITAYLEAEKETLPCFEKEEIEEDIEELKEIERYILEPAKLDFTAELYKMNKKLFVHGESNYQRCGKTNNYADLEMVKEILSNAISDYTEKFLCLATYMYAS